MKKVKSLIIIVLILAAAFLYAHIGKNNLRQKTKDTWHSALGVFCFSGEQ